MTENRFPCSLIACRNEIQSFCYFCAFFVVVVLPVNWCGRLCFPHFVAHSNISICAKLRLTTREHLGAFLLLFFLHHCFGKQTKFSQFGSIRFLTKIDHIMRKTASFNQKSCTFSVPFIALHCITKFERHDGCWRCMLTGIRWFCWLQPSVPSCSKFANSSGGKKIGWTSEVKSSK